MTHFLLIIARMFLPRIPSLSFYCTTKDFLRVDSVDYSHIDEHIFLSYQGIIKLFKSGFHIVSSKILFHGVNGRYKNKMGRTKLGKNNINTLIRWFIYFEFLNKGSKGFEVRSIREIKFTRI